MFRFLLQLLRDSKVSKICNITEALIEALLEQQAYSEVQVSELYYSISKYHI